MKLLKHTWNKIWESVLNNIGTYIFVFIFSGGYLFILNRVKQVQIWVGEISSKYIIISFLLWILIVAILLLVIYKQSISLRQLANQDKGVKFVTHLGVWWKVHSKNEYIEDFPYCPCCEPKKQLVQISWFPDEKYKCPGTNTEIQLYDEIPVKRKEILEGLYESYFYRFSIQKEEKIKDEVQKYKELNPNADDLSLINYMFTMEPLNKIPKKEQDAIKGKFNNFHSAFYFIERNYKTYKKYFK